MKAYHICIVKPEGYVHSLCFTEVAWLIQSALNSHGLSCETAYNQLAANRTNIVLGYHLLRFEDSLLRYRYIPYQLEQLSLREGVFAENIRQVLQKAQSIWDYSHENIQFLAGFGLQAAYLRLGYHEKLELIPPSPGKDIDVLFYGSLGDRRRVILERLRSAGLRVQVLFGVYGRERDEYIARSKLILNIHYYAAQILEAPRISYLLNNQCLVISEESPFNPYPLVSLSLAPYETLVEQCLYYIHHPEEMKRQRQLNYTQFKAHYAMVDLIKEVL